MKTLGLTSPIVLGKSEDIRRFGKEIMGPRHGEMSQSRQAIGQTRETVWVQPTPMGDVLVIYLEGADSVRANKQFAASNTSFDRWFKQQAQAFTGIDWSQPLPEGSVEVLQEMPSSQSKSGKTLAVAFPIAPGKSQDWKQWAQELKGSRANEYKEWLKRMELSTENLYLQHTPMGDFAVYYLEGNNPGKTMLDFAASNHPFDVWSKQQLGPIHGIDFSKPVPGLPELAFDWRA